MKMTAVRPKGGQQVETHPLKSINDSGNMVVLMAHESFSTTFKTLYRHGMQLIEDVGGYINQDGRFAMRKLSDVAAALYSAEAVRLGSCLMQVASWLLLERALRDNDMKAEYVAKEKQKIKLDFAEPPYNHAAWSELPQKFRDLIVETARLLERVRRLNNDDSNDENSNYGSDLIKCQLVLLEKAFNSTK